jgi:hypothetical protein
MDCLFQTFELYFISFDFLIHYDILLIKFVQLQFHGSDGYIPPSQSVLYFFDHIFTLTVKDLLSLRVE